MAKGGFRIPGCTDYSETPVGLYLAFLAAFFSFFSLGESLGLFFLSVRFLSWDLLMAQRYPVTDAFTHLAMASSLTLPTGVARRREGLAPRRTAHLPKRPWPLVRLEEVLGRGVHCYHLSQPD